MASPCAPVTFAETSAGQTSPRLLTFTPDEWWRLSGLYGFIAVLHIAGWGLFLYYSSRYPALVGLGLAAYMFGLRHAFDADHTCSCCSTS
jgi:high-affinity nickel-transport protein